MGWGAGAGRKRLSFFGGGFFTAEGRARSLELTPLMGDYDFEQSKDTNNREEEEQKEEEEKVTIKPFN